MIARRLAAFPLVTLAAPVLLDRLGDLTGPDALDPSLCLGLGRRAWAFRRGSEKHNFMPQGRIRSNSGSVLIQAAVNGMGVVQLPGYYGRPEIERGILRTMLGAWTSSEPFEFHIVYPPQRRLPQRVRRLIDFLVAEMRHDEQPTADRQPDSARLSVE